MARLFNVYQNSEKGSTKIQSGVTSPITIPGLLPGIAHSEGEYQVTAVDDGKLESEKVNVPAFTTKPTVVAVTGVTVNPNTTTLDIGQSADITVNVTPSNATNKEFTIEGGNDAIATHVISDGNVRFTGVSEGTFTATVKTTDGDKTTTVSVTVNPAEVPAG